MEGIDSIAIYEDLHCMEPSPEKARTPARFATRVASQFLAPENLEYLRLLFMQQIPPGPLRDYTLRALKDSTYEFAGGSAAGDTRILDEIASDPLAQRGELSASTDLWAEVRRINRIFFDDRMALLKEQSALITERKAPRHGPVSNEPIRDGLSDDNESYHMRMFISDSYRPPGLERLNDPGPNWAIHEDQSSWLPKDKKEILRKEARDCALAKGVAYPAKKMPPRNPQEFLPPHNMQAASMLYPQTPEVLKQQYGLKAFGGPAQKQPPQPQLPLKQARVNLPPPVPTWVAPRQMQPLHLPQRERFASAPAKSAMATSALPNLAPVRSKSGFAGINLGPKFAHLPLATSATTPPARFDPLNAPVMNPRLWGPNGPGRTNMDPEAAVAEYWGDDWPVESTTVGSTEIANVEYGEVESWGSHWQENGGTRFMRYESIPFWQKGGREGYDYDIEETLGTGERELDSNVRRWDMERPRTDASARNAALMAGPPAWNKAGGYAPVRPVQWGRYYGPRSGGNV